MIKEISGDEKNINLIVLEVTPPLHSINYK